jgi:hypothetical protein
MFSSALPFKSTHTIVSFFSYFSGTFFDHHRWEARIDYWDVKLGVGNPIVFELPKACEK